MSRSLLPSMVSRAAVHPISRTSVCQSARAARGTSLALIVAVCCVAGLVLGACTSARSQRAGHRALPAAAKDNPSLYAFALQREGSGFFQQARFEEALTRFEEANRLQPGNSTVNNMIGLCKLKLGRAAEALEEFGQALTITPSFTDARNNRGAAYLALEQFRLAEIDFVAVLSDSTYPHRWQVFYNLGMTYMQQGKLSAAIENFERAATGGQPVFDAFLRLSEVALEQGRNDVAVDWLERARLEFPDRIEASLRLGTLLVQLDRGEEARSLLENVIAASPSSEMADEARTQLASIGLR